MRALLLMCIGAALVAAAVSDNCPECDKPDPATMAKLDENAARLNRLVARAVDVSDTIKRRQSEYEDAEVQAQNMLQRLEKRNGVLCKGQFVCGGAAQQCADNLVVCDGVNDCDNGADEATDICTNPASPGSTFEGVTVFDKCTSRQPKRVSMDFISEDRGATMKSNLFVNARLTMTFNRDGVSVIDSLPLKGMYYHGFRRLEFTSPEEDGLALDMVFPPGENDVLLAYAVRESSGEVCAKFILRRQ